MRLTRTMMALSLFFTLSATAIAGVPKTVSYQGRLTNSGGTTVPNGTYSVRFTLFHDAVGGGGQWTEVQPVSIADGLFSAELGAVNPLPDTCCFDTPWLEIAATIGGLPVTMSPRMHMASTPSALYSGGVFGEATSGSSRARGIIAVKSPSGSGSPSSSSRMSSDSDDNGIDDMSAEMMADNDSASLRLNGLPPGTPVTGTLSMSASGGGARQRLSGRSGSTTGTIRMAATPDSAVAVHDCDSDGDGVPESEYRIVNDGGGKRADVLMKGRSGSTTGTIRMAATPDSAVSVMESDADGDGIAEARGIVVVHSPSGTGSSSKLQRLGGGILRGEAATEVDAIETRETLKQFFQTGDFPTQEQLVDASGSTFRAINTKGTGSNFRVALSATDSASSSLDCDSDGDGHAEAHANIAAALNGNVVIGCATDSDDDGIDDNDASLIVTPTTSSLAIKTKGTGAQRFSAGGDCDDTDASLHADFDVDNDGVMESSISQISDSGGTDHSMRVRLDSTPARISTNMTIERQTKSASFGQKSDLDGDGVTDMSAEVVTDNDSASFRLNGLPPGTPYIGNLSMSASGGGAHQRLSGRSGSTTGTIRMAATPDSAVSVIENDADNDGHAELSAAVSSVGNLGGGGGGASSAAYARMSADPNDDGIPDNTAEMIVTPTTSSVAIQTKGTGADKNRTIGSTTYPDSAVQIISSDEDGDGNRDMSIESKLKNLGLLTRTAVHRMVVDNDDDGTPDNSIEQIVTPTTSSVAIKSKGSGADKNRTISSTTYPDSAVQVVLSDDDGDGKAEFKLISLVTKEYVDSRISVDPDDDGVVDVSTETVVNADSATFRLNGLPPGIPVTSTIAMTSTPTGVHMEVGSATCDGTNWTNASDKNSKENFEQVNGAELLEKIGTLPITQWNYKQDDENVKHIGPTAQDFSDAFGLGNSDKTISTIDPSGVALVAIKELTKQNKDLKKKNSELENKLNDLQKQIEKLASSMKK